jgi:hypothetical protein
MQTRRLIVAVLGLIVLAGAFLTGGILIGERTASGANVTASGANPTASVDNRAAGPDQPSRDFMFQVIGVKTANQGGHTLNLFFHYRYPSGIADNDIPDYTRLRTAALDHLAAVDAAKNPYWEVLNNQLCARLKNGFPIQAITCELQVVGSENPGPHDEPGYRASIETIGDIEPLDVPGPAN